MLVARRGHGLLPYQERVYVFAGNGPKNNVEYFNLLTSEWVAISPLIEARSWPGSTVYRENIYVAGFGSAHIEKLDPVEHTWT